MTNFCINCKHCIQQYKRVGPPNKYCTHPETPAHVDVVTGTQTGGYDCYDARCDITSHGMPEDKKALAICGPEGKLYEGMTNG